MDNFAYQPDIDFRVNQGNIVNGRIFSVDGNSNNRGDHLIEVKSGAKIFRQQKFFKKLSIILLLLTIVFFIIMVIFISLYAKLPVTYCRTDECLRTAANYLWSMDQTVDPCDNFYQFVCGRWSEQHPNYGWWKSISSFTSINEKILIASLSALSGDNDDADLPEAVNKSKIFYQSCMDLDTLDTLGITSIYGVLEKISLPIVPGFMTVARNDSAYFFDWWKVDAQVKRILLMDIFIGVSVSPNNYNGSENVLYVGQIYQTSPLPSPSKTYKYPRNRKRNKEIDETDYQELVKNVHNNIIKYIVNIVFMNYTGTSAEDDLLQKAADVVTDVSDFIDTVVTNTTDLDQAEEDIYSITVETLQNEINLVLAKPQQNALLTYFKHLFNGTNVTIISSDLLYVTDSDVKFLKLILKFLNETPSINVELYMWWVAVYSMIINTSGEIADYISKQLNTLFSDPPILRSRSLECALLINNYMGYAISYVLADQTFPNTTKPKVERMILGLKQAFVNSVNQINWMDKQTKMVTLEKSTEMMSFIGYPDWLFQNGELDKYYNDVDVNPNFYLENMVNVIMSHTTKNFKSLREPHLRDWYSEPIEVNAFNSFSDNAINVPMAILNYPMYHLGLEVLNYASIGTILGHELIHGFDNTGRKHDKYGNNVQWWTNQTIEKFDNRTDCFIKQYDNFTLEGIKAHVDGKRTLGENLADNGGLNQAFAAYKNYVKKYGEEPKLPGFEDYTNYQIFFIAYASIWCEESSIEDLLDQIQYDVHSPNVIRVIGSLQNSEDFANVFQCSPGSYMNPHKKCKIW
ncbi:endothelin-converting enzyme 1 isoform X2 [Diorhabda carinulata]|uniref:endothelin-converting enzyme 1 isoform X2 n=2 Tax=Diorhabda carinulata TaxID=1163345 RepID=UPI0025A18530|nr:endothelin-converting enzyme 1 isoform X2 [Diorhabda carinulata]